MTQHNKFSFDDVLNQWGSFLRVQGKSDHTIAAYLRGIAHFRLWVEHVYHTPFVLSAVMPRDVRDWKAYQQTKEKARPATVNQRLVAVTRLFRWAVMQGLCRENPAEAVVGLRLPAPQPQGLSPIELRRLLRAAKDNLRDFAVIELLAGTGLRVGELLALTVGDVVVHERSGKVIVRKGKHGGYREIPLTADVRSALAGYVSTAHNGNDEPNAPLWRGTRGELTHRSSIVRLLRKYAHEVHLAPIHPHQLRHTFATRYLAANPDDLRGLARLLGHANLNTVMLYTEPSMDDLRARMERVESDVNL
jgi:integrase/recombinase XerC